MQGISIFRSVFLCCSVFAALYLFNFIFSSCAQIGMPVGGPRDTLPPVLVSAAPPNFSTDFSGARITLTFDEYIQLDNPFQNVLISPLPKKSPFIDFRLRTVTVRMYDTLQPNKTYSIQFGKTIRDLNEGNPFQDFDYVFSTGSYIDSLSISGSVTLAETGKTDSTLTVMLYTDLSDSAVYKQKPEYVTKLSGTGEFRFKYLSPGTYHIFALKDQGGQYLYNNPEQLFAFSDSAINLDAGYTGQVQLHAYEEEKPAQKAAAAVADTSLKVLTNVQGGVLDLLSPLRLTFNHPLRSFDSARVRLTDTLYNPVGRVPFSVDTSGKVVSVSRPWQGGEEFVLVIPADAVTDTSGRHLADSDTLRFRLKNESDYGSLKLTFKNLEKYENPVLQLVPESGTMESYPLTSGVFEKKLIAPGTYQVRILEDINRNGVWDPGNYAKRRQPELVHRVGEPISVRANWDNERDIEL